jgi:hypothetical protein
LGYSRVGGSAYCLVFRTAVIASFVAEAIQQGTPRPVKGLSAPGDRVAGLVSAGRNPDRAGTAARRSGP